MLRLTWRTLWARKFRLLLSVFAIVLGVSFVSGTLVFTHALGGAFDRIVEGSTSAVEIAPKGSGDFDSMQDNRSIPASVVAELADVPGVASVHPQVATSSLFVISADGKVVGGNGPPGLGFAFSGAHNIAGDPVLSLVEGRLPRGDGEVALETDTLERSGYRIGDTVTLASPGDPPTLRLTLVGEVRFASSLNGATLTVLDESFLQRLVLGGQDAYNQISLDLEDGASQAAVAQAAQRVLPEGIEARTGDAVVTENEKALDQVFGYLRTFLLVFAAIALFVGTYLILNTFSMLLTQRARELALLRALGGSRGQLIGSVLAEALTVGLVGATLGLGGGWVLAQALKALFGVIGLDLGDTTFPLTPTAVIASYAVGLLVTGVAGLAPALRASRVPPVAAMRADAVLPSRSLRWRMLLGAVLTGVGAVLMVVGFRAGGSSGLGALGGGTALVLVGAGQLSPLVGRPVISAFGVVYRRLFGPVGNLATENSLRDPRRTAATASALMIGLTLMTLASVFVASVKESQDVAIRQTVTSQFVISSVTNQPFSPAIAERAAGLPGVEAVAAVRQAFPEVDGDGAFTVAVDPRALARVLDVPVITGSLADLDPGTAITTGDNAASHGLSVGDTVTMTLQGGSQKLRLVATIPTRSALGADWVVSPETLEKGGLTPLDSQVFVAKSPGADTETVRDELEGVVADLPTVSVKDPEQLIADQKAQSDQFLTIIYALLGLSILIALLGVVNTLGLSIIERTREVGLLRAVGLTRRQLRRMIALEAVVIAVFGAVLGVALGTIFGVSLVKALAAEGISELAVPWASFAVFFVVAAVLGVLASVLPAWRASRLDVLTAIATE